jgi:hypothetical protein
VVAAVLSEAPAARAGFTSMFENYSVSYTQTSHLPPAAESSASFRVTANSTTNPNFTAVSLTVPVGSPLGLSGSGGAWDTGLFSHTFTTRAQLDAAFPAGTYTLNGTGAGVAAPTSVSIDYTQNAYPGQSFTFLWDSFVTGGVGSPSLFFTITASNGSQLFNQFLPTNLSGIQFGPNFFSANTQYTYQLGWFNDITGTSSGASTDLRFGFVTTGTFRTVPEPTSLVLGLIAGLTVVAARRISIRWRAAA